MRHLDETEPSGLAVRDCFIRIPDGVFSDFVEYLTNKAVAQTKEMRILKETSAAPTEAWRRQVRTVSGRIRFFQEGGSLRIAEEAEECVSELKPSTILM